MTLEQYLNYWKVNYGYVKVAKEELTPEIEKNAEDLISKVNSLLSSAGLSHMMISSGWRPKAVNASIKGAAPFSNHVKGLAVDVYDPHGDLDNWCMNNLPILEEIGLWLEHPAATKTWCHLQSIAPRSGARVFYP